MSITAVLVFAVYLLGLLLAFGRHPIFALFSYLWIFYNDPTSSWWGQDLPDLRYSLVAALVALIAAIRLKDVRTSTWSASGGMKLLMLYAGWTWVQTYWAVNVPAHVQGATLFTKYAILSYVIYKIACDRQNIERFLWAHIGGCFLFGWMAFRMNVSGRLETIGGPGVDDANLLAAHLITGLVIAGLMFIGIRGYMRWVAFLTLPFMMNAIILTQSRGGFLSMFAAGGAALFLSPKRYRFFVTGAAVLGGGLLLILANEGFWERISTIFEGSEQTTEETRMQLIKPQLEMFKDHPFGAGHRGNEFLSPQYMPPELLSNSGRRSAHNTFMAALVDQGFVGAISLILMYLWMAVTLLRLKRMDKKGLPVELGLMRAAVGAALGSLFVSGLFLNLLKTEVQIWLMAVLASLAAVSTKAIAQSAETSGRPPARVQSRGGYAKKV